MFSHEVDNCAYFNHSYLTYSKDAFIIKYIRNMFVHGQIETFLMVLTTLQ